MKKIFWLFLIFFFLQNLFAQETVTKKPKIGLVLSGGGAKGLAHIGVLKVLEQAGVKVDYIGGTSMGSIIGGLYASGYNARQLDSIFNATNFDELLQDYIPRSSKSFYEKRNDEIYALTLPFQNFKIGFPLAYSKGMYNYNLFAKLTFPVRDITDFSKLPIPFICMATDIEKGKPVVLNKGYLPQAMLASSAIPSLFAPVEIDGKLLIDGGVTDNYPVEEVRKMGADIIIGVDVQDNLKDRNNLKNASKILIQVSNVEMINKMEAKRKLTDIYIKPDITNFSVISFEEGKKIVRNGEEAAFLVFEQLKKIGDTTRVFKPVIKPNSNDSILIGKIDVTKLDNNTRAFVLGKLHFKPKSKISFSDLRKGIDNLNATQNFSSINYIIEKKSDGDALKINLTENQIKTFLKFGLHYDGLYKSALLFNITHKKSLFKNDVASFDLALGDNIRYNFDYYIDNGFYLSFGLKARFNTFSRDITNDFNNGQTFQQFGINSFNINYSDFSNQAYVQTVFIQKFLIGGGIEFKHLKIKSKTLDTENQIFDNSDYLGVFGYFKYDSFNNKYFPKKGWYFDGNATSYLYSSNYSNTFKRYSIIKGDVGFVKTFYKKFTLKINSETGFSVGPKSSPYLDFILGGYGYMTINNFKHFYGYDFVSLAADSYIKSCLTVDYEFIKKNHLNFSANYANVENKLYSTGNWLKKPTYNGYALGYGMETVIGPIEVKYSWSPELSKGYTWFNVGFWF